MPLCCCLLDGATELSKQQRQGERDTDSAIANEMAKAKNEMEFIQRLLLLGAGESGKSTFFKQLTTIYGDGFSDRERSDYINIIHRNVVDNFVVLLEKCNEFAEQKELGVQFDSAENSKIAAEILDSEDQIVVNKEFADIVTKLWKDRGLQKTYDMRSQFQLSDSTEYFFQKVHQLVNTSNQYIPTDDDILRARNKTTGVVERSFSIQGHNFRIFDVGGQRSERKKWIHCFENVTAILFVVGISAYDQVLEEDLKTNRMIEALRLFDWVANNRYFFDEKKQTGAALILFLNKKDLLQEKLKKKPFVFKFTPNPEDMRKYPAVEYKGDPHDYHQVEAFILGEFKKRVKNHDQGQLYYPHVTIATSKTNVETVFNAVRDRIIQESLRDAGL